MVGSTPPSLMRTAVCLFRSLFAVTKPSFMNGLGFTAQIQILLTVSALLASLCFLCLLPLAILSLNPGASMGSALFL
jgi:hypothetical protein